MLANVQFIAKSTTDLSRVRYYPGAIPAGFVPLSHIPGMCGVVAEGILQWAEKTTKLGDGIEVATVVKLLLEKRMSASTIEARKLFSGLDRLVCVWTGSTLRYSFDVDHVIPFDLWHNNDVWNLLPSSKTAIGKKSNKLPSTEILRSLKDCIVGYWELLRGKSSQRFDREAETLLVMLPSNWQTPFMDRCVTRSR